MPSIKHVVEQELKANPGLGTTSLVEVVRQTLPGANYATVTRHRRAFLAIHNRSSVSHRIWKHYQRVGLPNGKEGTIVAIQMNGKGEQLIAIKVKNSIKLYKGSQLAPVRDPS